MIILEQPYVSDKFIQLAVEQHIPVLDNEMSEHLCRQGYPLQIYNEQAFIAEYFKRGRIYTMSENALGWIAAHLPDKTLLQKIELLKNKATFRQICSSLYPDFFFCEVQTEALSGINASKLTFPLVIKPSVGFLSAGVHVVNNEREWKAIVEDIRQNFENESKQFPEFVVNTHKFLIEQYIRGEEYAVDAYFDEQGAPVILNIFHHRFASETDTSDHLYCSSLALYNTYEKVFVGFLAETNRVLQLKNFPMHIEFRYDGTRAIPIEINPLRFAGFCLNELQTHISGIHPVWAYLNNMHITKEQMWKGKENDVYSFMVLERPADVPAGSVFDSEKFTNSLMHVLELRKVEADVGVAATAFTRTDAAHLQELDAVLNINMHDFMSIK
ncbi:MAG: ATP-grasp domain-containing protein [Bacteroidales bacterium]|nr:ATP-grasp domain-containing protein [Bacteroidales bacterium]